MQQHLEHRSTQELVQLFDKQIQLSDEPYSESRHSPGSISVDTPETIDLQVTPANYSISQHYNHSSHLVHVIDEDKKGDAQIVKHTPQDLSTHQILTQHNIPPSSLLRSQLTLFEQADDKQRLQLIQLWSISPPSYTANGGQALADEMGEYQTTSVEQEQHLARLRYQSTASAEQVHEWNGANGIEHIGTPWAREDLHAAETYIISGYEQLARRDYDEQAKEMLITTTSLYPGFASNNGERHLERPTDEDSEGWHAYLWGRFMETQSNMSKQASQFQQQQHQTMISSQELRDEEML